MLEVKNLTKVYKPKKGVPVRALDGVSLSFPETGMVFLLGKSGSGKSTLLNVCGGLDEPTSGEIIVKGRSSKSFSGKDFDSYRNTFIGFVFQEYNILNEFTVEDNIALALELQNKPKDKAAVQKLLEEVDLAGYANRKPNTLSGGQKQRIAIARALIKSPEIIMADEPTGALDSATGKQVLETLKKLSKDKLVIVVSHDRDFAEQYGDRIIELKDGKVISDVSKNLEKQVALTENIGSTSRVLCIKQGAELTEQDFAEIKSFLSRSQSDVIIASGEKEVQNFKKSNRITENGEQEVFKETVDGEKKTYRPEDSRFISSRLPLRHAVKMGLSGLKSKPVRLFFTILLCTVAFVLFGLLSTMTLYESEPTFKQSLMDSKESILYLQKQYRSEVIWYENNEEGNRYEMTDMAAFTKAELAEMKNTYGKDLFGGVQLWSEYNISTQTSPYWSNAVNMVAYLDADNSLYGKINGKYPSQKDELCISSYMADVLINCQTYDDKGNVTDFKTREDILGKSIKFLGVNYKITGIFDSGELPAECEILKTETNTADNQSLWKQLNTALQDGLHQVVFTTEETVKRLAGDFMYNRFDTVDYQKLATAFNIGEEVVMPDYANATYVGISKLSDKKVYALNKDKTVPGEKEVLLPSARFFEYAARVFEEKLKGSENDVNTYEKYSKLLEQCYELMNGGTWSEDGELIPFSEKEMEKRVSPVLAALKKEKANMQLIVQQFDNDNGAAFGEQVTYTVIGFWLMDDPNRGYDYMYIADEAESALWLAQKERLQYYEEYSTKYERPADAYYNQVVVPYDHSQAQTDAFWLIHNNKDFADDDTRIILTSTIGNELRMVDEVIKSMSTIFLYVGLVLAVFAILLFSNFISVSISQKRRDIGILRAVGAKSTDVFKIFFSESAFIALLCVAISTVGCVFLADFINGLLTESLRASLLVFGAPSFGLLVGIAVLTAILATFLPVYSAARKKPIDSIRAI